MANLATAPDAQSAWKPWQPTRRHPWDLRLAAHLFRRAGFGASHAQLNSAVSSNPQTCIDQLLSACGNDAAAMQTFSKQMDAMASGLATSEPQELESWWLYRMLFTPAPLLEKLTLFWHGHFATSAAIVPNSAMMLVQNETLRTHALGPFEPLVQAISRDQAMLTYLSSTTNARLHPNENYARELMELFCLGVGNYTERDIQETARCFTGWEIRRGKFRFNRHQHDFDNKTLFGQTGKFDGDEAIHIILAQKDAPRFIARKLVNYFVCDHPISDELIEPLARDLRESDFRIAPTVRRILNSRYFYSEASVGQKIRGPVDLAIGLLRSLEATTGTIALAEALRPLGQRLFHPPNVKGWPGGRRWINASTFIGRVNLVTRLIVDSKVHFGGVTLAEYLGNQHGFDSPEVLVDTLAQSQLAVPLTDTIRRDLLHIAEQSKDPTTEVLLALTALPEFQLG